MAAEEFFVSVIIILAAARVLGELFQRIHQPSLVGELLAGIILGPTILMFIMPSGDLKLLSNLAVFFLMFLAGLEMNPEEIRKSGKKAIVISVIAFLIPLLSGIGISLLFGMTTIQAMFMGLLMSITAVPVSAIILMEFGLIKSKLGNTIITAAIINDILSLVFLSVILQLVDSGPAGTVDFGSILFGALKIVAFIAGIFIFDIILRKTSHWLPNRVEPFFSRLKTKEAAFGILLMTTILLSLVAEEIGLHFIIGTFFSGLIVYKQVIGKQNFDRVYGIISAITFGFFAPLFFAMVGIEFNGRSIVDALPLFIGLLGVAILGKIGGGYIGARLAKFKKKESTGIAFLMNGRGMVELVIASIGFELGILDLTLFSVAVAIGVITTIMAPLLFRSFIKAGEIEAEPVPESENIDLPSSKRESESSSFP